MKIAISRMVQWTSATKRGGAKIQSKRMSTNQVLQKCAGEKKASYDKPITTKTNEAFLFRREKRRKKIS